MYFDNFILYIRFRIFKECSCQRNLKAMPFSNVVSGTFPVRLDDVVKSLSNKEFQKKLFVEFGIREA